MNRESFAFHQKQTHTARCCQLSMENQEPKPHQLTGLRSRGKQHTKSQTQIITPLATYRGQLIGRSLWVTLTCSGHTPLARRYPARQRRRRTRLRECRHLSADKKKKAPRIGPQARAASDLFCRDPSGAWWRTPVSSQPSQSRVSRQVPDPIANEWVPACGIEPSF